MSEIRDHMESHVLIESPEDGPVDLLQRATGLSKQRGGKLTTAMTGLLDGAPECKVMVDPWA